jgi:hypothetical protein
MLNGKEIISMTTETILRPDAKGRVGLASLAKKLEGQLGGLPISGYSAQITPDGAILLKPRVEMDADEASVFILSDADRDALLAALGSPPSPSEPLRAAAEAHRQRVAPERGVGA